MGAVPAGLAPSRLRAPNGNGQPQRVAWRTSWLAAGSIKVGRFRRERFKAFP